MRDPKDPRQPRRLPGTDALRLQHDRAMPAPLQLERRREPTDPGANHHDVHRADPKGDSPLPRQLSREGDCPLKVRRVADLQDIVDDLEAEIRRPISVEDRRWRLLAHSAQPDETDPVRQRSILTRETPPDVTAWLEGLGLQRARELVDVPPNDDLGMTRRGCLPIRHGDVLLGFLWVIVGDQPAVRRRARGARPRWPRGRRQPVAALERGRREPAALRVAVARRAGRRGRGGQARRGAALARRPARSRSRSARARPTSPSGSAAAAARPTSRGSRTTRGSCSSRATPTGCPTPSASLGASGGVSAPFSALADTRQPPPARPNSPRCA